jgi:hypothetical protein
MEAMMAARGPYLVEEECAGHVEGAMQVVGDTAFFAARGPDEGAKLGFQQAFLTFFGAENHDQGHGAFRELGGRTG